MNSPCLLDVRIGRHLKISTAQRHNANRLYLAGEAIAQFEPAEAVQHQSAAARLTCA
jgi:hypothetical protein